MKKHSFTRLITMMSLIASLVFILFVTLGNVDSYAADDNWMECGKTYTINVFYDSDDNVKYNFKAEVYDKDGNRINYKLTMSYVSGDGVCDTELTAPDGGTRGGIFPYDSDVVSKYHKTVTRTVYYLGDYDDDNPYDIFEFYLRHPWEGEEGYDSAKDDYDFDENGDWLRGKSMTITFRVDRVVIKDDPDDPEPENTIQPRIAPITIHFNANGGTVSRKSISAYTGEKYGALPEPKYSNSDYYFAGWYTKKTGGTKVSSSTIVSYTSDKTLFAHWKQRKSIAKAKVTVSSPTYSGEKLKPSVKVVLGKKTLKNGTDFKVTYSNNVNTGKKAVAKIMGIGKYKGSVSKKFTIKPLTLDNKNSKVSLSFKECEYNGKYIKPEVTVKYDGKKLKKDTDFTIKYNNNKKVGTAKGIVTGKGNYKGSRTVSFKITKAKQPIKLSSGSLCVRYRDLGSSVDVTVSGVKEKATVKASSDKTSVATVKKAGDKYRITFRDAGTAKITFETAKSTTNYKKTKKTIEVTVIDDRKASTLSCSRDGTKVEQFIMNPKETKSFNLNAATNGDGAIKYEIIEGDKTILTIDNNGKVILTGKEGEVIIKVSVKGTMKYKPKSIKIDIISTLKDLYWPVRIKDKNNELIAKYSIGSHPGDIVKGNPHRGVDIVYEKGEKWYSASDGEIYYVMRGCKHNGSENHEDCEPNHPELDSSKNDYGVVCNAGFGNGVIVKTKINKKTYYFHYAHMDSVSDKLKEGDKIYKGTYLGTVGNKGFSFGKHAHFEIDLETNHNSTSIWQYWGNPVNNDPERNSVFSYYFNKE